MQLSLKYRPRLFSEVIGQPVSVRILQNTLRMQRIPSAILVTGGHGLGKTTLARIYAKYLNCESPVDGEPCLVCSACREPESLSFLELNTANVNGVDDVRELDNLCAQVVVGKYRVLCLDEAHQLTKQAQAALLKLIEEPPANTIFLLVTTDPEKLEDTIRSRCLSLPLRPATPDELFTNLQKICSQEGIICEEAVLRRLSEISSIRDAQQVLNQLAVLAGSDKITMETLDSSGQLISTDQLKALADVLTQKDLAYGLTSVREWLSNGVDLEQLFTEGLPVLLRDFLVFVTGCEASYMTGISQESLEKYCTLSLADITKFLREWEMSVEVMRWSSFPKVIWGVYLAKIFE